jgi:hypothetical protein
MKSKDSAYVFNAEYHVVSERERQIKINEYQKKWRKNNPEKIKSHIQKYRKNNREKYRKYLKEYSIKNKERINFQRRKRRATDEGDKDRLSDRQRATLKRQKYTDKYVTKVVQGILKIPDHIIGNMKLKDKTEVLIRIKRVNNDD